LRWKQRLPVDRRARATGIVGGSMLAGNRRRRWLKLSGNRALRWPRRSRATAMCTVGPMLRATGAAVTASLGQPCEAKRMLGQPGTPRRMLGQPSKRSSSCGGNFGARPFRGARIDGQPAMTTPQRAARASCGTTARCSAVRDRPIAKATLRSRLRSHRDPLVEQATARRARFEDLGQPRKASKRPVRSAGNCGANANDARSGKSGASGRRSHRATGGSARRSSRAIGGFGAPEDPAKSRTAAFVLQSRGTELWRPIVEATPRCRRWSRSDSSSGDRARGVHTTHFRAGQPARQSVDTTNSSSAQPAKRAWSANSRRGQPRTESVDATKRLRGALRGRRRRENKLIAWATRR
jgi:hypothetical protein